LVVIALAIVVFTSLDGPGLGDRTGPPVEDLIVEQTTLKPGLIRLTVRNDGPDPVTIAQIAVNDSYTDFKVDKDSIPRLQKAKLQIAYPWVEGEAYELSLLTSSGGTIDHTIDAATETPTNGLSFFGLMALLGIYVGMIPVSLGMLWLPFIRRIRPHWMQLLMALTVGLLGFLAFDAFTEGSELANQGSQAFGGVTLVALGAVFAYLLLLTVEVWLKRKRTGSASGSLNGMHLALLVAIGIGLHNLGEGLVIGAAYSVGALALGSFLVVGFAIHNTTEGLAIVAPTTTLRPSLRQLTGLGLIAGLPAVLGAWIGAASINPSLTVLMFGAGVGAIVQVIQQIAPSIKDDGGRYLHPISIAGILLGVSIMYATGLLVSV